MRYLLIFGVTTLVVLACRNRTAPTGPSTLAPDGMLTVRTARLPRRPVVNAAVMVFGGGMYWTDENGQVNVPVEYSGNFVEIIEHGYLSPRRIVYVPGMVDHLLPDDEQLPGQWLHTAYYPKDDDYLIRPRKGLISVELSDELLAHPLMPEATRKAIEHINRTQPHVDYFIVESGGVVKMEFAPNDPLFSDERFPDAWAVIESTLEEGYIVRSRVVWKFVVREGDARERDASHLWKAVAHELGHHTGIRGHPPGGIMNKNPIEVDDFSFREKEALTYLFLRPPGTRKPDDSTQRPSSPTTLRTQQFEQVSTRVIGCSVQH